MPASRTINRPPPGGHTIGKTTMEDNNLNIQPADIANDALLRNLAICHKLKQATALIACGRTEIAIEMINTIIHFQGKIDADIRSLRDMACNPVLQKKYWDGGEMLYAYSADHQCPKTGNPLRVPLSWNQTDKETGEHISHELPLEQIQRMRPSER